MTMQSQPSTDVESSGGLGDVAVPVLDVRRLTVSYPGAAAPVIDGLDLRVARGEFVCVVGPSGCGKTTLLRTVTGLAPHDSGEVRVCGKVPVGPSPELAVVFQEYARSLLPWLTVEANVRLPLTYMRLSRKEIAARVEEALNAVGLGDSHGKHPWQLSGGMQQRVAIARALAYRPELLVMDEPFASVDAQTRMDLEDLILRLWQSQGMTVVLVTHDIDEAVYLADRVVALSTSPARVVEERTVSIPRPRDQITSKAHPQFAAHRSRIFELLKGER